MNFKLPLPLPGCRAEVLGYAPAGTVIPQQTHSANVAIIGSPTELPDTDAVVTAAGRLPIGVRTADCVPILMVDPEAHVIAAVHSGWRGTAAGITSRAIQAMTSLGAEPRRIRVAMGPCICTSCFEVGEDVAAQFNERFVVRNALWPKPHVDLAAAIRAQLLYTGVDANAIAMPTACTFESACLYSARRSGPDTGRLVSVIELD